MKSKTIEFFKELSKIPRESSNEKNIADYIVKFAEERNLEYQRDNYNNVIIKKYIKNSEPIILQCHLDMVCEKETNKIFNFTTDSIEVYEDNGYLTANGTTLGADNGIGIAQILNILDSDINISIEAIFTSNEETTMEGAENIDLSSLKGKNMINLDGFDSDTILIESASFTDIDLNLNYEFDDEANHLYKISLSGLNGGHSGFDIHHNKGNSIILLANLLLHINDVKISAFAGGTKINVIPSTSEAIITTNEDINNIVNNFIDTEKKNYKNLNITIEKIEKNRKILSRNESLRLLNSLSTFKHGVFNSNNRGEVTTSENLAIIDLSNNLIRIGLRSSIEKERKDILNYLDYYCNSNHYELVITGYQPGFKTNENANLIQDLIQAYKQINNCNPSIKSVHISVEVGLLKEKISDLEVAIISPNIIGAHSTEEKVEIESINKCDEWLVKFLSNIRSQTKTM